MYIHLLEFKVHDSLFGIRTEYIKTIYDIEEVKNVSNMPDYMAGITKHGKKVYPLICLDNLLGLSDKKCMPIGKSAITISIGNKLYSLVVDEILQIQEIEKTGSSDDIINFYNLKGEVLEELTPQFLKMKIKIPSFSYKKADISEKLESMDKKADEEGFIVFKLKDKLFAINTKFVKKVENIENLKRSISLDEDWIEGVFLVKNHLIKVGNLQKFFNIGEDIGENLIITEKQHSYFGFVVDEIIDIVNIKSSTINKGKNLENILNQFFIYENNIVSIISERFIENTLETYSLKDTKSKEYEQIRSDFTKEIDVLILDILGEKFAVKMENVEEVFEYDDVVITPYPSENKYIIGIMASRSESHFVVSFENLYGKTLEKTEDTRIVILQDDDIKVAIVVSGILDIISVPEENISLFDDDTQFIKGVVIDKKGNIINIPNIKWIKDQFNDEKLPQKA